jgi:asparagine synthase (glutamine-hydrolysing)
MLYVDMKVQLVDDMLTKVDRMSMAHSLEVRVPLLDQRLVEFMAQLPGTMKMRGLTLKFLLKRLARRILPREVLSRPKAGFTIPVAGWIRTDLRDMVHDCLSRERVVAQGLFDAGAIEALLRDHWRGERNHSHNIWNLLMFSLWYDRYAR